MAEDLQLPSQQDTHRPKPSAVSPHFSTRRWARRCLQSIVLLLALAAGLAYWQWQRWLQPVGGSEPIQVVIEPGSSSRSIGQKLYQAGVIRSDLAWALWSRTLARDWVFQAGTYLLDPNQDMMAVAQQLRQGNVLQTRLTIPEGWRIDQMAAALAQRNWFAADTFIAMAQVIPPLDWLPQDLNSLEGYLFPDTYLFPVEQVEGPLPEHEKAQTVVNAMLQRFVSVALPLFQQHSTPLSLHEWVTLASIVEREAVVPEERALIAGVFLNRLRQGIPLGADPTVEYALNIRQTPDRRLTLAEVRTPSPYNTYLNPGLPPGPIASPGLASLAAVLEPEQTDFLYFVARYDGTHVFSKTLAEHEAAQLQIIRERQAEQASPGTATSP
ncbi:endolytic transglycosylase MltG [Thermostichus vulcanus]|uniref:Endolytic murein transglycosylase n=1 Tax=Thermostichus vulcanus str. 'Rupite' TaxID=2813851 RepID=A0ABT0CAZ7_THEVL|nr:endolytic transglycosylase MltG [Thermostichus vulcanus]MCJ2542959.1 endolytic transglycosylase MltG [Thermostichus vulcanus str. 'Rupite']